MQRRCLVRKAPPRYPEAIGIQPSATQVVASGGRSGSHSGGHQVVIRVVIQVIPWTDVSGEHQVFSTVIITWIFLAPLQAQQRLTRLTSTRPVFQNISPLLTFTHTNPQQQISSKKFMHHFIPPEYFPRGVNHSESDVRSGPRLIRPRLSKIRALDIHPHQGLTARYHPLFTSGAFRSEATSHPNYTTETLPQIWW